MTVLHAQPYNLEAAGFYFDDATDYEVKAEGRTDRYGCPVEEYEIQFIDGEDADAQLFNVCGINQVTLNLWFDEIEPLDDWQKPALFFLVSQRGYDVRDALQKLDEVTLYEGELLEAATELFDECYAHEIPEKLRFYVDYERFANDCRLGGDMDEFQFDGETYTCTNAACV